MCFKKPKLILFCARLSFTYNVFILFHFLDDTSCHRIEVKGWSFFTSGTYELSTKIAIAAPYTKVWEKPGEDRFIFYDGKPEGWKIGRERGLVTGLYLYKSKWSLVK